MNGMIAQILALALGQVDMRSTIVETKRSAIGGVLIALFLLTAYGALVTALALWVSVEAGPVAAALVVAAAAIAAALVTLAVVAVLNRQTEQARIARQLAMRSQVDPLASGLMRELPEMVRQSPIASTALVAAFVYVLAKSRGFGRPPAK